MCGMWGLACVHVWYTLGATLPMLNASERFTAGCRHQGLKQALKSGLLLARSQPPIFFFCIILSCHTSVSAPNVDIGFIC